MTRLFWITLCGLLSVSLAAVEVPVVEEVNKLAGIDLFGEGGLWKETPAEVAKRLKLNFKSDGGGENQVLSVYLKQRDIFMCPAAEVKIFSASGLVSRIDIVLFNKGDSSVGSRKSAFRSELRKRNSGLERLLESTFGRSRRVFFGSGNLSEARPAWMFGEHALVLDFSDGEYLMIHVVPESELGDKRRRLTDEQRVAPLETYAGRVVRKDNGDVLIEGIPMVDQGSKGYCVPATVERIARYFGIADVDMHKLAEKSRTGVGGGTTLGGILRGTRKLLGEYGLRTGETTKLRRQTVWKYVDKGIPLVWFHYSTPPFRKRIDDSIARRGKVSFEEWSDELRKQKKIKKGVSGGHVALLIGYNQKTGEIAVSNSWGERYRVSWVRVADMEQIDSGESLYAVTPRRESPPED